MSSQNDPPNRKLARLVQVLDEDIPSPEEAREAVARMGIDVGVMADDIRKQIMEDDSPHVKALRAIHASDEVLAYASTHATAAGVAASAAASALDEATDFYLCNLIRSAVPVCPLAEAVLRGPGL